MTTLGQKDQNQKLIANKNEPYSNLGGNKTGGVAPNARHDQIDHEYRYYNWALIGTALACVGNALRWGLGYTLTLNIILLISLHSVEAFLCLLAWRAKRHFSHDQQTLVTKLWIFFLLASVAYYAWRFIELWLQTGSFQSFGHVLQYVAVDLFFGIAMPAYFWRTGRKLEDELPRN